MLRDLTRAADDPPKQTLSATVLCARLLSFSRRHVALGVPSRKKKIRYIGYYSFLNKLDPPLSLTGFTPENHRLKKDSLTFEHFCTFEHVHVLRLTKPIIPFTVVLSIAMATIVIHGTDNKGGGGAERGRQEKSLFLPQPSAKR